MDETKALLDPLDVLATEFTARQRQGECPTIEEYVERYPELKEDICVLFPTIATLEKQKVNRQRTSDGRVSLAGRQLERLGDFRIVRELGRGGMGIVYEAEQQSLGRRVAIKVLPRQSLVDSKQLGRFQREAQTAAGLHHTNVVPVFGVGEEGGYHYIVMQLIAGTGLDQVLAQLADSPSAESTEADGLATEASSNPAKRTADVAAAASRLVSQASTPDSGKGEPSTATEDPDATVRAKDLPTGLSDPLQVGPTSWRNVARIGVQVAELLMEQGQMTEARSLLETSTATLRAVPEVDQRRPGAHVRLLNQGYTNLAEVYMRLGQENLADEALRQAEQYRDDRRRPPDHPDD